MSAIASTRYGKVEGDEHSGLFVFKGIPFAAPPIGSRRWMPPGKPESWMGVREARRFGASAPQNASRLTAMKIEGEQSEDCLSLNVWTPGLDRKRRPVMVWIHGGAFSMGSGSQAIYDGTVLAKRGDVVIVTTNYRLGPLGFLRLCDVTGGRIPTTGNEGLLDQMAALEWVRDNIAEFGGDPGNVTIFGESAGGMSVGMLLVMPGARGLFGKAIPQSGASHSAASVERANRRAERILSRVGASPHDVGALRAVPVEELLKGAISADGVTPDPELGIGYQPVVDGKLIQRPGNEMVADGAASGVAVMVGTTLEEWKLFAAFNPALQNLDRGRLMGIMNKRLTADFAAPILETYERALPRRGSSATPFEVLCAIETDCFFRMPAVRLAESQSRHQPRVFNYLFTWRSPALRGALGACHALELGFVFGTNHVPGMPQFAGTGPDAERLAVAMQDAWLAFARTGDPSCETLGAWSGYTAARRATMIFNAARKVEDAPFEEERRAWDKVPDNMLGPL